MKGEALNKTLADTPLERKAKALDDTMGDVKAKLLVVTVSLHPKKAKTNLERLGDVKAEAVV